MTREGLEGWWGGEASKHMVRGRRDPASHLAEEEVRLQEEKREIGLYGVSAPNAVRLSSVRTVTGCW